MWLLITLKRSFNPWSKKIFAHCMSYSIYTQNQITLHAHIKCELCLKSHNNVTIINNQGHLINYNEMQENEINICESKFKNKMWPLGLISFLGNFIYVTNVKLARWISSNIRFKRAHKQEAKKDWIEFMLCGDLFPPFCIPLFAQLNL